MQDTFMDYSPMEMDIMWQSEISHSAKMTNQLCVIFALWLINFVIFQKVMDPRESMNKSLRV